MRPPEKVLASIVESGLRAPSAENKHYLQFEFARDSVTLLTTDADTWVAAPHRKMLALLAYGAVIENMQLGSASLGLAMNVALYPHPERPNAIAELRWSRPETPVAADPLAQAVATRHTNRRFYRRGEVGAPLRARLDAAAAAVTTARLDWLDERARRALALRAIRLAETERFVGHRLHEELFGAVRFERGWRAATDEFLAPASLEVEPPMRPGFAALRHPRVMRLAGWFGAHHLLGWRAGYLPAVSAPLLGLIWASGPPDEAAIAAGRAFQRVWLAATVEGLALQPMAATTALARQTAGDGWVRPEPQSRLRAALQTLQAGRPDEAYMLFRIGRAAAPSAVAGRRPWRDYLVAGPEAQALAGGSVAE